MTTTYADYFFASRKSITWTQQIYLYLFFRWLLGFHPAVEGREGWP